MAETQNKLLQVRVSEQYLTRLDRWRSKQSPIPSRSEAIRVLTASGLKKPSALELAGSGGMK